jgi:hypothetical protein
MGEIADDMLGGVMCEGCGEYLNCAINEDDDACEDMGIPMYCSEACATSRGASKEQVCPH